MGLGCTPQTPPREDEIQPNFGNWSIFESLLRHNYGQASTSYQPMTFFVSFEIKLHEWTDGRTDGRRDGRMDGISDIVTSWVKQYLQGGGVYLSQTDQNYVYKASTRKCYTLWNNYRNFFSDLIPIQLWPRLPRLTRFRNTA